MGRARGANGIVTGKITAGAYGTVDASGHRKLPVASIELGESQDLLDNDILGFGRDPQEAGDDVIKVEGQAVVPVDLRHIGFWLRLLLGDPVTSAGVAATGSITFSALPANLSIITINGTDVTFKTSGAVAASHEVAIGATVAETVANLVALLNASADASIDDATYSASLSGTVLNIVHDTLGTSGNSFTLAKGTTPNPNCTLSGATLTGGAASGAYNHVFTAGQLSHPDAAIEIGMPEVPRYGMNYGVMVDSLSIQMQRSGLLNATLALIGQGETVGASSQAGTLETDWEIERFSQFAGFIEDGGVPLARIESATLRIGNNLDKDESIRSDGRIGGADPAMLSVGLDITVRFADRVMEAKADAREHLSLRMGWQISALKRLDFIMERVRLPRRAPGLAGPGGVKVTYQLKPAENSATQRTLRAILVNDVSAY